jgi:endonuclease-8
MPEGPQVARYARLQSDVLAGKRVRADSPNGRSDDVAEAIDGLKLHGIEAIGKHLIYDFGKDRFLHVHLGRFGNFDTGPMPLPEPRGILRFRLYTRQQWFELRGAIAIELFDAPMRALLEARIGPSPLDPQADPARAFAKIAKSRAPIALILMDQKIVAGIGNIYRSEILFMHGVHPRSEGRSLEESTWQAMWLDLVRLMRDGERIGRIVTTSPADREKPKGNARRGDRYYVYRRTGLPCRRCGSLVVTAVMGNRNVFWCPHDQPAHVDAEPNSKRGVRRVT